VDEYVDSITSISFKCSTCDKLYKRKPKELSQIKCPCKVKHIEYEKIVSKNFIVLENYKNIRHKILHQCKICKLIFKTSPKSIINSVNGSLYEKLNFKKSGKTQLNYWWVVKGVRKHRFNYNKRKLVKQGHDSTKTEVEIMHSLGNFRIWGCGQTRYILNI
jgi:hypothetical protein